MTSKNPRISGGCHSTQGGNLKSSSTLLLLPSLLQFTLIKMHPRLNSIQSKSITKDIYSSQGKATRRLSKWQLLQGQLLANVRVSQVSIQNLFGGLSALKEKFSRGRTRQEINRQNQDERNATRPFIGSPIIKGEQIKRFYSYQNLSTQLHLQKFATLINLPVKEDNSAFCWSCGGKMRTETTKTRYVIINRFTPVQMQLEEDGEEDDCGKRAEWYTNVIVTKSALNGWLDAEVQVWAPEGATVADGVPAVVRLGVADESGATSKSEGALLNLEGAHNRMVRLRYQFKGFLQEEDLQRATGGLSHKCTFQVELQYCSKVEAEPGLRIRDLGEKSRGVMCPVVPSEGRRDVRVKTRDGVLVLKRRGFGTLNYHNIFKLLRNQMLLSEDHVSVKLENFSAQTVLEALLQTVKGPRPRDPEGPLVVQQLQDLLKLAKVLKSNKLMDWCVQRLLEGLTSCNFLETSEVLTRLCWKPVVVARLRKFLLENFPEILSGAKKRNVLQYQNAVLSIIFMTGLNHKKRSSK